LLKDGGADTLVKSGGTVLGSDSVNTVENVAVLGLSRETIVNESGLNSLLGSHDGDSFGGSGSETTAEVVELVLFGENVLLGKVVDTETDGVLGHGEHKKCRVSSVETEKTIFGPGLANDVKSAHSVELGV
jgi:hypothetical protein